MKSILKTLWDFLLFLLGIKGSSRNRVSSSVSQKIKSKWEASVEPGLKTRNPAQLRQALITADKLLDNALGNVVSGNKMSDRLKNAKDLYEWSQYDRIWKAHKVRNALVHDIDYEPTYYVLEEAVRDLREGMEVLGVNL
jgi:hypothetical protein